MSCHAGSRSGGTNACASLTTQPEALIASIAWDLGEGEVAGVNVWENADGHKATSSWTRVRPFVEAEGEPPTPPKRHGEPLAFYLPPPVLALGQELDPAGTAVEIAKLGHPSRPGHL